MVVVIENQLDTCLTNRLAASRAVEDDVCHALATKVLRGALTHHPANGIDNIRLATAIWPNH